MCGIYGVIGPNANTINQDQINQIINSLRHRGPDAQNFIQNKEYLFIHTRLSIIDLSHH